MKKTQKPKLISYLQTFLDFQKVVKLLLTCLKEITPATCVFFGTNQGKGRSIAVTPQNSATNFLPYGRIRLDKGETISFENNSHETGFICLKGPAVGTTGGEIFSLSH